MPKLYFCSLFIALDVCFLHPFRSEAFRQALDQHFPGYVRPEGL